MLAHCRLTISVIYNKQKLGGSVEGYCKNLFITRLKNINNYEKTE